MLFPLTVVVCGTLTNPVNGQVSDTAGTTFGQTATYSCSTGFNLVGDNTRTCQATGMWSGSAPTCQGTFMCIVKANICLCKVEDRGLDYLHMCVYTRSMLQCTRVLALPATVEVSNCI